MPTFTHSPKAVSITTVDHHMMHSFNFIAHEGRVTNRFEFINEFSSFTR